MLFNKSKSKVREREKLPLNEREAGSYLILGFANLINHQFAKGLLFLSVQLGYILFMVLFGAKGLHDLFTLGTNKQGWVKPQGSKIPILVQGDNSMLCMIYGVAVLVVTLLFVGVYLANLSSARHLVALRKRGKRPNTFLQDVRSLMDEKFHITLMSAPVLGIALFTILPLIFMILIAFTNYDKSHQPPGNLFEWVGLDNFKSMLGGNEALAGTFFPVLTWTLVWAVIATATNYLFGIILAMMINKKGIRFKSMWRTIFVLTIALPQFITLLVMRNMFNDYGPINELLIQLGFITNATRITFLSNALLAKITVLIVNLWIGIPYTMLITSGILMNIPNDMYEAAKIDGASPVKIFFKITMPYVLFVTTPYLITQFIGNINNFNVIYLLTGGGPNTSDYYQAGKTDLLVTWLYKLTADVRDYNLASTIGILVFLISAVISLVTYRNTGAYKKEEEFS